MKNKIRAIIGSLLPLWLLVVSLLAITGHAAGERTQKNAQTEAVAPAALPSEADIQHAIQQLNSNATIGEADKIRIKEEYGQILAQLQNYESWRKRYQELNDLVKKAPAQIEAGNRELEQINVEKPPVIPKEVNPSQADLMLSQVEDSLDSLRQQLNDTATEIQGIFERQSNLPELLSSVRRRLEEVGQETSAIAAAGENPEEASVSKMLEQISQKALQEEMKTYELEIQSYEDRIELLNNQQDLETRKIAKAEQTAEAWREVVNRLRKTDAEQDATEARKAGEEAASMPLKLQDLAAENAELAQERTGPDGISAKIEASKSKLESINKTLDKIKEDYSSVTRRVKAAGLNTTLGFYLVHKRAELPNMREFKRSIALRQTEIATVQLKLLEYQDMRSSLKDLRSAAKKILSEISEPSAMSRADMQAWIEKHLQDRRDYLDTVIGDYNNYFVNLVDLDVSEQQLLAETKRYSDFLNENVLWIKSTQPLGLTDLKHLWAAAGELLTRLQWQSSAVALFEYYWKSPGEILVLFILTIVWLRLHAVINRQFSRFSERFDSRPPRFRQLVYAMSLTVGKAAFLPVIGGIISYLIGTPAEASEAFKALSAGLTRASYLLFFCEFSRQLCRPQGLGEVQFQWPPALLATFRRRLKRGSLLIVPLILLFQTISSMRNETVDNSLGRLIFMISMATVAIMVYRTHLDSKQVISGLLAVARHSIGPLRRLLLFLTLPPAALILAAAAGYYYTASALAWRLCLSSELIVGMLVLQAMFRCWHVLQTQSREKAMSSRHDQVEPATANHLPASKPAAAAAQTARLALVHKNMERLVKLGLILIFCSGLYAIWSDSLPALNVLNRVQVWSYSGAVSETVHTAEGAGSVQSMQKTMPVTLGDLVMSLLIISLTVFAARTMPMLIEDTLLIKLSIDAGSRYAYRTLLMYGIYLVGLIIAMRHVGITWSSVTMVAAAFSVGLGFGLQEIFANFISGLILLFERPIRVGDVVTVTGIIGKVSRIRIRATTITNWDRTELIVPNKEFITGQLVNWTLTDSILRLEFKLGIAYGSDTQKACDIMLEIAKNNGLVLANPEPYVMFQDFGESALELVLRVYINSPSDIIQTRHEINMSIDEAFRKEHIEIPPPQREIHIRSVDLPLEALKSKNTGE